MEYQWNMNVNVLFFPRYFSPLNGKWRGKMMISCDLTIFFPTKSWEIVPCIRQMPTGSRTTVMF